MQFKAAKKAFKHGQSCRNCGKKLASHKMTVDHIIPVSEPGVDPFMGGLQFWAIENPARGVLHKFIGQPVMKYEPWHYGSPWTKQTALWGEFNVPQRKYMEWEDVPKIDGLYQRPGRGKPSLAFMHKSAYDLIDEFKDLPRPTSDMEFRSFCSQKFAQAFFMDNR